jgi:hypothetical protein
MQAEDDDVAAIDWLAKDAAGKDRRREGKRIVGVAVRVFRDEQVIADQEGRNHRAGRDVERLKQERADDQCDDQGVNNHPHGLGESAFFPFCPGLHAHRPMVPFG